MGGVSAFALLLISFLLSYSYPLKMPALRESCCCPVSCKICIATKTVLLVLMDCLFFSFNCWGSVRFFFWGRVERRKMVEGVCEGLEY